MRVQGGRGGLKEGAGVLGVRATGRAGDISGEMLGGSCASWRRKGEEGDDRRARVRRERGACERATRWGELRRPRALAGGPERVRGEQAVRDAGLGRVARWRAGERAGRESQLGHGELGRPGWAGSREFGLFWVWVLFPLYLSFLFLSLTQAQLFEFKRNLEFKPL